jgi:hypothetical protein
MTADDMLLRTIQAEISRRSPAQQAHIRVCYQELRTLYDACGSAGPLALALLAAEEHASATEEDER